MAAICKCCGKKLGFMTGSNVLSEQYNAPMCDACFYSFKTKLNILEHSADISELSVNSEEAIRVINECKFPEDAKNYVLSYTEEFIQELADKIQRKIDNQALESQKREEEARLAILLRERADHHMLTTGFSFDGYKILSYNGVISGSVVIGTGFLSELEAGISDLLGGRSELFSEKLEKARELALNHLIAKSVQKGGNAIIGIDFDYITFINNMIGVIANGTTVLIEKTDQ